jgi:hypothetical protein
VTLGLTSGQQLVLIMKYKASRDASERAALKAEIDKWQAGNRDEIGLGDDVYDWSNRRAKEIVGYTD